MALIPVYRMAAVRPLELMCPMEGIRTVTPGSMRETSEAFSPGDFLSPPFSAPSEERAGCRTLTRDP